MHFNVVLIKSTASDWAQFAINKATLNNTQPLT